MDYNFYPLDNTRQQHQRQNGYLPPSANSNNNPFAPIGYSCQRSTSLLPSIGSHRSSSSNSSSMNGNHHHNNNHMDYASNDLKSSPAFGTYPLYNMSPASRSGMGSIAAHDHYMMNNRLYSLEKNNPSSSLSTPIPVAVNGSDTSSMQSLNTQRFNFY